MRKINHSKIKAVTSKSTKTIKNEGVRVFTKRSIKYVYYRQFPERKKNYVRDILFIDGNTLPHPTRYRVDHQIEQLRANGLSADSIFYEKLSMDLLSRYRGFVFFRCPITDTVREFIQLASQHNKTCFFDVDDLVIDQKYTDQIDYVKNMSLQDKAHYDDGVNRMRETLKLCDYTITTTERLKQELKNYSKEVFINRNVASDEMVALSLKAINNTKKQDSKIIIGYFSGSITHNENFDLVLPSLVRLLKKHSNVYLKIVGILDVPNELEPYKERIIRVSFMDWRTMTAEVASCDIVIAPLVKSVFNEAKSENKWTEASLAKVVTVASDIGAFSYAIDDGDTGILAKDNEWYEKLDDLIMDKDKRSRIAAKAHTKVLTEHTTIGAGFSIAHFMSQKLARNIAFVLPSTDISGGINVVLKHADILKAAGWDVTLIDAIDKKSFINAAKKYNYRTTIPGYNVITKHKTKIEAHFDTLVATLWSTEKFINQYPNVENRLYLVQNYETDFYLWGDGARILANATYSQQTDMKYITISLWCQKWLKEKFGKPSKYASNGIELQNYPVRKREFNKSKKVQILIEGDSQSEYKNTDEAFRIVERLDPDKYEIAYLSYRREPKDWYRVDRFYNRISPDKVGEVYASCDILIKTSLLESFSYPPLEMMATGGLSVVVPNDGNVEYLLDGYNCLFYKQGDIEDGLSKINQLISDSKLRKKLIDNGLSTARRYDWKNVEEAILKIYE